MSSRPRWINQSRLDLYTPPLPFFFHLSSLLTVCFSCSLSLSLLRTEPAGDSFVLLINDENHILHNTSKLKEIGDREKEHQGPFIPIKFLSRSNPSSALFVLSAVQTQRGPVIHFFPLKWSLAVWDFFWDTIIPCFRAESFVSVSNTSCAWAAATTGCQHCSVSSHSQRKHRKSRRVSGDSGLSISQWCTAGCSVPVRSCDVLFLHKESLYRFLKSCLLHDQKISCR